MSDIWLTRQESFINSDETNKYTIVLVGCGAIGSAIALVAGKMGFNKFHLYDNDRVSLENMSNQFFNWESVDKSKVEALAKILQSFGGKNILIHQNYMKYSVTESYPFSSYSFGNEIEKNKSLPKIILISAVDNMATRKIMGKRLLSLNETERPYYYIECRMGLQEFIVFSLKNTDSNGYLRYQDELYEDTEAHDAPCTEKSIMFTPMGVSFIVGKILSNIVRNVDMNFYGIGMDINSLDFELPRLKMFTTKKQKVANIKRIEELKKIADTEIDFETEVQNEELMQPIDIETNTQNVES